MSDWFCLAGLADSAASDARLDWDSAHGALVASRANDEHFDEVSAVDDFAASGADEKRLDKSFEIGTRRRPTSALCGRGFLTGSGFRKAEATATSGCQESLGLTCTISRE